MRDKLDKDDQTQKQLIQVLESVGPLCEYRSPEHLVGVMRDIDRTMANCREQFRTLPTDAERTFYALNIIEEILLSIRSRASMCETSRPDLACENLDFYDLTMKWLEFVRSEMQQHAPVGQ